MTSPETTCAPITPLTPTLQRVAQHLANGLVPQEIALATGLSAETIRQYLRDIRHRLHCPPRCKPPVIVHRLFATEQVPVPPAKRPTPQLDPEERLLLRAVAEHSDARDVALAAKLAPPDLRPALDQLLAVTGSPDTTRLVILAHGWKLLTNEQIHPARSRPVLRPSAPTGDRARPAATPLTSARVDGAIYEMRTLRTGAEREEAAALVQDRQRWLTLRGLPVPAHTDVPALFRDPQTTEAAGLFDDGKLLACAIPEREPRLGWGEGPCLFLGHVHTLPDQPDDITRLITLWASDFAARQGLPVVRAEAPARHPLDAEPIAALLRRLTDTGWDVRSPGTGREGDRVARLELTAEHRSGLRALIGCRVHAPTAAPGERGSARRPPNPNAPTSPTN
ncbi:helix-turn-helix transcriptional regulator [Streptomyces fructofermentans]|uniref:helix-turn-helix transcriptional regulator n=1 Tax=Streptomyces fructofermentans TaxID=152141 RepID=UPI0033F001D5